MCVFQEIIFKGFWYCFEFILFWLNVVVVVLCGVCVCCWTSYKSSRRQEAKPKSYFHLINTVYTFSRLLESLEVNVLPINIICFVIHILFTSLLTLFYMHTIVLSFP